MPKKGQAKITVSDATKERIRCTAEAEGLSMAGLIRKMLGDLESEQPIPEGTEEKEEVSYSGYTKFGTHFTVNPDGSIYINGEKITGLVVRIIYEILQGRITWIRKIDQTDAEEVKENE